MPEDEAHDVVTGAGYAVGSIDALGNGGGPRRVRQARGVTALGVDVIVMPAEFAGRGHCHCIPPGVGGKDGYVEDDGHLLRSEEIG